MPWREKLYVIISVEIILFYGIWMDIADRRLWEIFVNECIEYTNTANKLTVSLTLDISLNCSLFFSPISNKPQFRTYLVQEMMAWWMVLLFPFSSKGYCIFCCYHCAACFVILIWFSMHIAIYDSLSKICVFDKILNSSWC